MIYHILDEKYAYLETKGFHKVAKGDFVSLTPHAESKGIPIKIGTNKYVIEQVKSVIHIDELTAAIVVGSPVQPKKKDKDE